MIDPTGSLREFLSQNPLPWLHYDETKGKFVMVIDNHLMSTYRMCPQHFVNMHVLGLRRKASGLSGSMSTKASRIWFLEFGIVLHKMLELYYRNFRNPGFNPIDFICENAGKMWIEHSMDEFSEEKEYKTIGGAAGFIGLLSQYVMILSPENEKIRVIATEVSFGKNLEVPLFASYDSHPDFEMYLSGRMDILVDDGYFICPLDHKSRGVFKGELGLEYQTDEGPTGYIYALKKILPTFVPEDMVLKRDCSKILMNFIQKAPASDPATRFKRIPIRKTEWQLEQYRLRMINTGEEILNSLVQFAVSFPVHRNTMVCQSWMYRQCAFFDICRQASQEGELITIQNGFVKTPLWDTEAVGAAE